MKNKYYAVKIGYNPGIYKDCDKAKKQVIGYSGSLMKAFGSKKKAEEFMKMNKEILKEKTSPNKFYVVTRGRQPGVYKKYEDALKQIKGYKNNSMKLIKDEKEAYRYYSEYLESNRNTDIKLEPSSKKSVVKKALANHVFVDGSFNSKTNEYGYGGILICNKGTYTFKGSGKDNSLATMGALAGELLAAMEAIKLAVELELDEITILYDCQAIELYSEDRVNKNAVQYQYKKFYDSKKDKLKIYFDKVKSHSGIVGNEIADILAKSACGNNLRDSEKIYLNMMEGLSL